jgi:CHAT domain-containing protein/Tfp pilus assembly protein PilF
MSAATLRHDCWWGMRCRPLVLAGAVLLALSIDAGSQEPKATKPLTADQQEKLKERDHLAAEANKLQMAGKLAEAIAAMEKAAALHREVWGTDHPAAIGPLNFIADAHEARDEFAAARKSRQEVVRILVKLHGDEHWQVSDARLKLTDLDRLEKMSAADRQRLRSARQMYSQIAQLHQQGKLREAMALAEKTLAVWKELLGDKHPEYAISLNSVAVLSAALGNAARAEPLYQQVSELRKQVQGEKHPDYASSLNNLAGLYVSQGKYSKAEPLYIQALEIQKQSIGEKHRNYASTLANLAGLYESQKNYAKAEPLCRQALELRKQVLGEKHPHYALSLNSLGMLYQAQGDYAKAAAVYTEALDIQKQVFGDKHNRYAAGLHNLGTLYLDEGNYARATPLLQRAASLRQELFGEKHPDYVISLHGLAILYDRQGDYARAEPLYRRTLELCQQVLGDKHPYYAITLTNLARLYATQGDYTRAEPLNRQALELRKQVGGEDHPDYAAVLINLARLYRMQGNYAKAEPLYRRALDLQKRLLGEKHPYYGISLNDLAVLYTAQGDYAEAATLCGRALELYKETLGEKNPEYATSLHNLAVLYQLQGDYTRAEPVRQQAVALTRDHLDLAAAAQSERQQLRMTESLRVHLDGYLSVTRAAGQTGAKAYGPVLSWKGAITARQQRLRLERHDPELAAELRSVSSRLAALAFATPDPRQRDTYQQQTLQLTERKEQLEKDLAQKSAAMRQQQQQTRLSPEQLQQSLSPGTVLVDFLEYQHVAADPKRKGRLTAERRLAAFVVPSARSPMKSADVVQLDLGAVQPLAEAVDKWRQSVGTRTRPVENDEDPALLLRQRLWQPLEPYLKDAATVLVSPDGVVARLPLAALPGSKPGSFLIEETTLVLVPTPQLLPGLLGEQTAESKPSLLLVGAVDYGAEAAAANASSGLGREAVLPAADRAKVSWPRLPGSKTEIQAIRDSFRRYAPDGAAVLLEGGQATEAAMRQQAPKHRYLHLATHGFFADPRLRSALLPEEKTLLETGQFGREGFIGFHPGLLSGLVLAGANRPVQPDRDDGILTALEVADLDLANVDLAVLSACETGLGTTAGGEGVLGLQRAFQVAGARNVVATLWKVDDDATAALMALFYHKLWQEKKPALAALREAQLTLYHHPERTVALAKERGPDFDKVVKLPATPPKEAKPDGKAPVKHWAAFVLSGTGK